MKRLAAAACSLALACSSSPPELVVSPPDGVDWIVLLERDGDGAVVKATGLIEWRAGEPFEIHAASDRDLQIAGWRSSTLSAIGALERVRADGAAHELAAAEGCAPRMPPADFAARWSAGGELTPIGAADVVPLTAPLLADLCPPIAAERPLAVDASCGDALCSVRVERSGTCGFAVELTGCRIAMMRGLVHPTGELCVETEAGNACAPVSDNAYSARSLACSGSSPACRADVYLAPADPVLAIDRVRLAPPGAPVHENHDNPAINGSSMADGFAFGLVALEDRLVVPTASIARAPCPLDRGATELTFVDPSTLSVISRRPSPPCLASVGRDPMGAGFVGVVRDGDRWMAARFDSTGERLASAPLEDRTQAAPGAAPLLVAEDLPRDIEVLEDPTRLFVFVQRRTDDKPKTLGIVLDASTLVPIGRFAVERRGFSAAAVDGVTIAITESEGRRLKLIDPSSGGVRHDVTLPRPFFTPRESVLDVSYHRAAARALVAVNELPAVHVIDPATGAYVAAALPFDRPLVPVTAAEWEPSLALVTGGILDEVDPTASHAAGALLDVRGARFIGRSIALGDGIATRTVKDRSGASWVLLPWAGELVRIRSLRPSTGP